MPTWGRPDADVPRVEPAIAVQCIRIDARTEVTGLATILGIAILAAAAAPRIEEPDCGLVEFSRLNTSRILDTIDIYAVLENDRVRYQIPVTIDGFRFPAFAAAGRPVRHLHRFECAGGVSLSFPRPSRQAAEDRMSAACGPRGGGAFTRC